MPRLPLLAALSILLSAPALAQRPGPDLNLVAAASASASVVGSWWEGTLSTIQFYDPTTGHWEAPNGTGTFLLLHADGSFRAGGILNVTTGYCTSTLMVDERGTYTASADSLILSRQRGNSRATNTCWSDVALRELEPETQRYGYSLPSDGTLVRTQSGAVHSRMRPMSGGETPPPDGLVALRHFDPAGEQFISLIDQVAPLDTGFVFGVNRWDDREKAVLFTLPDGMESASLEEVGVHFAHRSPAEGHIYTVFVYEGTAETGPVGDRLWVDHFGFSGILDDGDPATPSPPTVHRFTQPVAVGRTFFVSVRMGGADAWANRALLAIAHAATVGQRVAEVWEAWADGSWHNASDVWWGDGAPGSGAAGAHLWVEARVRPDDATPAEDGPTSGALALSAPAPNPARGRAEVVLTPAGTGPVTVEVFDALGRRMAVLHDGPAAAGPLPLTLETGALPAGAYVVRAVGQGGAVSRTFTVVR